MRRRDFLTLAGAAATLPAVALAQLTTAVPRIIVLSNNMTDSTRLSLFRGFAERGYVDGKNVSIEFLTAPTIAEIPAYAATAIARKPDLIVTFQSPAPVALKEAGTTIPVVFTGLVDPQAISVVSNYLHPGGNMTGNMTGGLAFTGKAMGLAHEIVPQMVRMAYLGMPDDPVYPASLAQVTAAAKALNIDTIALETVQGADLRPIVERASRSAAQGMLVGSNYLKTLPVSALLAQLALEQKLPTFANSSSPARDGMLLGFGTNNDAVYRNAVSYVDAILKGAKPGDPPVEQPREFEAIVNLKTAKALGITVPQSVLFQANEVIQ
jgi:putative ABC transport system substrate-binding protein